MENESQTSIRSFNPVISNQSSILILGTMPSVKSLAFSEYYGNKQNAFWTIMFAIFDQKYSENYCDKLLLINKHKLALWDVLQSCDRINSLDSAIQNEKPNDIKALLLEYPNIKAIIFSSQKAAFYFKKYIGVVDGITFLTLPSPSGANARMSLNEKINKWKQLIELL